MKTRGSFPKTCAATDAVLLPTNSWVEKIFSKYDSRYHPYLLTKSFLRLPVGIAYGLIGIAGGTAVGIGGCMLTADSRSNGSDLCQASLEASGYLISKSVDLAGFTLKPDLRHWSKLPLAFIITRGEPLGTDLDSCFAQATLLSRPLTLAE